MNEFRTVTVVGLGYIGLPTATVIASTGIRVHGVDIHPHVVDTINQGRIHIVEPDLDALVAEVVSNGTLRASLTPAPADAFIIAVPTPFRDGFQPDTSFIQAAATAIAPVLQAGNLVILESTSPVGATEQLARWLADLRPDLTFPKQGSAPAQINVAYCPERVLPGQILKELTTNERVVGGLSPRCAERAERLYRSFVTSPCITTDARTAEMCKLTENSFRDVNIAFANELSIICDGLGINVRELIALANRHPRVNILSPGPGVGGHCIAVDPWFIVAQSPETARLIRTAREVNDGKPAWVIDQITRMCHQLMRDRQVEARDVTVAFFGLAFKPDIDDLRESPALEIVHKWAAAASGQVLVVEPHVEELPEPLVGQARLVSADTAFKHADLLVFLVAHSAFKKLVPQCLERPVIDPCGVLSRYQWN
jgi:UDP-N-acetyl-D-mannosaminuronic acid dehydrogenase